MHPEASDDTHAHTVRPHVPALSAPVDLAQVRRQQPAVAQQSAVLALQGHAARACETQVGLGGQAHGTARRRQRVPVMGWPSPRGRAASRGSGVRRRTNGTGTPHALCHDHAPPSPSGNHVTVAESTGGRFAG